ncbi:MAG: endonuclease/exonuclease/phosphatase [Candidatus Aminicenantes bacterium]|nr:endonuclease/exonuclease/phosphatase [Candidatus Aminicenantes bacterium]NIM79185.1 endonuclease/exonuclease/phosphatase [Candidatus Aminicenantes bacterium]NIN18471.1 endonuclease/exonuclease/phosphatase [Candidatus Aminicenantes bacterium]NIN42359.1 endonuclease/exonuclease/phosphatase [Candidatus Aminicenantes bacterium]NIN85125.1 endonuclease/exonuclease/phosphatase [Candidatus Aminicenantes bacterium]
MKTYFIGWWNVENLFDVFDSQDRPEWLQKQLEEELEGWTGEVLDKKIRQLSSIIVKMNNGRGPDILGVCEIENENVMKKLAVKVEEGLNHRSYDVVHHDTKDQRGIDVAFIYDREKFRAGEPFSHVVLKRNATRDIFQVNFECLENNQKIVLLGNHWPSRRGGELHSEPYRIIAAETLSYWLERIPEKIGDEDISVLIMGDFNDEPFNRSITDYALGTNCKEKVINARNPRLYNLMYKFLGEGIGTHYFSNSPNLLDQFLVNKNMINDAGAFQVAAKGGEYDVRIEMFAEMKSGGDYPAPIRFARPSSDWYNENGYSDHYPISIRVKG